MSVIELIGDWLANIAASPGAHGDPGPGTGMGALPATPGAAGGPPGGSPGADGGPGGGPGGDGGAGGDGGGGGDGDGEKKPPTLGELIDSGWDAVKDLAGRADEVIEIGTKDNRTPDEELVWGIAGPNPMDAILAGGGDQKQTPGGHSEGTRIPGAGGAGLASDMAKYGETGAKGITTVIKANKHKRAAIEKALSHRPSYQGQSK